MESFSEKAARCFAFSISVSFQNGGNPQAVSRDKKDDLHLAHVGKAGWVGRLPVFLRAGKTYDSGAGDLPHN